MCGRCKGLGLAHRVLIFQAIQPTQQMVSEREAVMLVDRTEDGKAIAYLIIQWQPWSSRKRSFSSRRARSFDVRGQFSLYLLLLLRILSVESFGASMLVGFTQQASYTCNFNSSYSTVFPILLYVPLQLFNTNAHIYPFRFSPSIYLATYT